MVLVHGKTTIVNEFVLYHLKLKRYTIGVLTLEADAGEYGENLLSREIGRKLSLFDNPVDKVAYLQQDAVKEAADKLFLNEDGSPSFYLIDDRGDFDSIQSKIEELIISCGVQIIVIDVLSDIFAGESLDFQEKFMRWQKSTVKAYPVIFINIIHSRKAASGQQTASNGGMLSEEDMVGSSAQYKSSGINIIIQRDKLAESDVDRDTTYIYLPKNRAGGVTGLATSLYYENATHTYYKLEMYKKMYPEKFEEVSGF